MMEDKKQENKLFLIPSLLYPGTTDFVLPTEIRSIVKDIHYYFVEDIRSARRFLSELKAGLEIEQLLFYKVDKDSTEAEVREYLQAIPSGSYVGVISEAGCPCVADPGALPVSIAHQKGWKVIPLVGPSSILMALMASGFSGQSFAFHGYLPIEKDQRVKAIRNLEKESSERKQTQIFMETPYRNNNLFEDLLKVCYSDTKICIAVNITSPEEFIRVKTVKEWKNESLDLHKKPAIFVLSV